MTTRTCGNCCFCKSRDIYDTTGTCVYSDKLVQKGKTTEESKCKKHLYRAEKESSR